MKESRSFSGQRLDVETQFNVGGDVFCIYSTLSTFRTLSVSVVDDHNQPVHQRKVPVNGEPLSLSLNLDRATLSIELDAAPTV